LKSKRRIRGGFWRAAPRLAAAVLLAPVALADGRAIAAESAVSPAGSDRAAKPPAKVRQLRLSDWVLQQGAAPDAYPLGLSWRVPDEVPAQISIKLELVTALADEDRTIRAEAGAVKRLRSWIAGLPATGRVPVVNADGRWLQMNPAHDPVLGPGHTIVMPRRPRTVTVITDQAARCAVLHQAGREAKDYLAACRASGGSRADWAWIAQPDGRVQRYGVAAWNLEKQDEPAPGAWIWAPGRGSGWPEKFSELLIRFLATQGPAPDPNQPGGASPNAATYDLALVPGNTADAPPDDARGATASPDVGFQLSGGMSVGLSAAAPATPPRDPPQLPTVPNDPVLLREERTTRSRSPSVTSSDWGTVGLLQTPTARMREAGSLSFSYTHVSPYSRGNVIFQPFDWLEGGFRYTDISNRLYGPEELSGDQTFKDKSIDVKFGVWSESAYLPAVAVGLRDVGGTGLFAGEYVVANKRAGDFDFSLGLGWGYAGGRGDIRNPLHVFSARFDERKGSTEQGGDFSFSRYFRGPTAVFGGVQYHTPWQPLTLKVEYEGNNYKSEPLGNSFRQRSPVNFGVSYAALPGVDVSLGLERGNTVMFGVTLHARLPRLSQPKLSDPKPVAVAATRPTRAPEWSTTVRDLRTQTDWDVRSIEQHGDELRVRIQDAGAISWRYRIDRAAAVLHRDAPANIDRFSLIYRDGGLDMAEHVVDRQAWAAERTQPVPPRERRETVIARAPEPKPEIDVVHATSSSRAFEHGLRLSYAQILGGPDAFALWQLGLVESARLRLREDTWIQGSVRLRLADNYDKFKYTGPSNLPRVRTFQREFVTSSTLTMPLLQATHVGRASQNHFYSAYGGYLEEMYAGVGGEWLYRPFGSRFAAGVDVNAVRQREFEQHFGLRDYSTVTGHASIYWDTGWKDVLATVNVGRYLAKDIGATLQLARVFKNGVVIGAFATKTDVSAAEFGEGSFDKGIFVSVPFDALFTRTTRGSFATLWRPLTRDGGAMLLRQVQLHALTGARSDRTLWYESAPLPADRLKVSEQKAEPAAKTATSQPYTRVTTKAPAAQWERPSSLQEHRLAEALYAQGFRNIKVDYDTTHRVVVTASHTDLRPVSVAVGRAARTALLQAPVEARGIEVTLLHGPTPQARYEFFDLPRLQRYFDGELKAEELMPYVKVHWINPAAAERDPIQRINDLTSGSQPQIVGALVPETFSVSRVANDYIGAGRAAARVDWLRAGALGASLALSSSLLDKRANRFARDHADSKWLDNGVKLGDAIPWLAVGGAGLAAIDGSNPRRSRTGYAALEAGATALVLTQGLKYGVGRARPSSGLSHTRFEPGTSNDAFHSFPSTHTTLAWSVLTPFALEYDAPWIYGIAAAANLARVGSREHWVSDTVASSLIGYGLGRLFWQSGREQGNGEPRVFFDGAKLSMLWDWK
jgi:hypothetical protein